MIIKLSGKPEEIGALVREISRPRNEITIQTRTLDGDSLHELMRKLSRPEPTTGGSDLSRSEKQRISMRADAIRKRKRIQREAENQIPGHIVSQDIACWMLACGCEQCVTKYGKCPNEESSKETRPTYQGDVPVFG